MVEIIEVPASFKDMFYIASVGDKLGYKGEFGNFHIVILPLGVEYKIHKNNFSRFFKFVN